MMKPHYTHDCTNCRFLGTTFRCDDHSATDHYVCGPEGRGVLIAREGDEGPDYRAVDVQVWSNRQGLGSGPLAITYQMYLWEMFNRERTA